MAILAAGIVAAVVIVAVSRGRAPAPTAGAIPRASVAEVRVAARAALERARPALVRACWTAETRGDDDIDHVVARFTLSFDPDGVLRIAGVTRTHPEMPRVLACLQQQPLRFSVPTPGAPTSVEIALGLPTSRAGDDDVGRNPAFPPPS